MASSLLSNCVNVTRACSLGSNKSPSREMITCVLYLQNENDRRASIGTANGRMSEVGGTAPVQMGLHDTSQHCFPPTVDVFANNSIQKITTTFKEAKPHVLGARRYIRSRAVDGRSYKIRLDALTYVVADHKSFAPSAHKPCSSSLGPTELPGFAASTLHSSAFRVPLG